MNNEKVAMVLKNIKEKILNKSFSHRTISIALSVWILSLTAYYCINTPWLSYLGSGRPDTKELITETLKFQWVHVFLSRLPYAFYALILNFIALLMGNRILRWLKVGFDSNLNRIVFSVPLGWSIYSIGIFCLGISGLLYVEAVYCYLTLLGILSILEIERFFREWKALYTQETGRQRTLCSLNQQGVNEVKPRCLSSRFKIDKADPESSSGQALIFLPIITIFIAVQFVTSFSPVWETDVLIYHMALPKLYIKHHALVHVPGFFFSTLPTHTGMLYLLGLITSGETLSKLFSFSISSMFLISIFSIGKKYFSRGTGYLAAIIMPFLPFFYSYFSEPCVDASLGLFSLLGVYAFFVWIEERKEGFLYLSIVNCSLAAATKIQGLFLVPLFFVGFLVTLTPTLPLKGEGRVGVKQFFKKLAWCILAVGIIALPWYIRSWWLTGDPIFPFLYKYLGASTSGGWNEYSNECFWAFHLLPYWSGAKSFSDFIRINKTLFSSGFGLSSLPPIIVIFLIPVLITLRNWNLSACLPERGSQSGNVQAGKLIRYLLFIILVYYIFFIFTSPTIRYFYGGIAILSIVVAHFVKTVWTKYLFTRIPVIFCIVAFTIVSFYGPVMLLEGPFFAGLGVLDRRQFLNDHPHVRIASWVNENLPKDSKLLSWDMRGYHLGREYVMVNPAFQGVLDFSRINDVQTFLKSIKELGITHLIYHPRGFFTLKEDVAKFLNRCVSELLENGKIALIKQIGSSAIYSVDVPSDYFVLDDNTIRFNDESHRKYLLRGWSSTEEWGTWSEGGESVILVNFKGIKNEIASSSPPEADGLAMTNTGDYTMLIKATGFSVSGKQQSVKIYLDDTLLGEHTFTHPVTYFEDFEVKIPSAYFKEGNRQIRFVYGFTGSPAEYGMGPDLRQLAMGVSSIEFR